MSLYRPNSNKTFIFAVLFLFLVVLLMIPLRPSVWDREETLLETKDTAQQIGSDTLLRRDSLVLTTISIQDTQVTFVPNADSTALDTNFVVQTVEAVDTTIVSLTIPPSQPVVIKKAETTGPNLLFLLWWFFLFVALAGIIYRWLTTRWQKQYWLEYNAKLQPLATLSNSNPNINFDFSELSSKTIAIDKPNVLVTQDSIIETTEELIVEPETISDNPTKEKEEPVPLETETEQKTIESELASSTVTTQRAKTPFNRRWYVLLLVEYFGRLPRILFEMGRGISSIFSFFSTGNQKRKPLDLKWQDGVSVIMLLFFILCKAVIFPNQPTSVIENICLGLFVWGVPALLRLHWGLGVVGILLILGEVVSLIIYIVLQALKDMEPSDGDYTVPLIGLAVSVGIILLYWANKKGLFRKFKSLKTILFISIAVGAYFMFLPFINDWNQTLGLYNGFGDLVAKLIGIYILYQIVIGILKTNVEKAERIAPNLATTSTISANTTSNKEPFSKDEKVSKPLSPEELKELFRTPNWYKKADLDQFDMISMPNMQLYAQSEFIVLYLPDGINLRQLYLSNNNFQEIPYEISTLEQLEILNLSYNRISTIFPEIEHLKNLKVLFLAHNNISTIPSELAKLTQLTQIDLTGNPLTEEAIHQLKIDFPNATLKFDSPKVEAITPKELIDETPKIESTEDKDLVKTVRKILQKELKTSDQIYALAVLMDKKLPDLPLSVLQEFPNLKSLFLNSNLFTEIPEAIYQLPTLTTLGLSYNKITHLPDKISTLQNLKELYVSGNPIRSFSPAITQLQNLIKIDLGSLGFTTFPAFLLKMQQLESISLAGNHILRIPESIQDLTHLKELNLSFSGINTIPNEIFSLSNLRSLEWTGNNLERIPSKITTLQNLEKLVIGFNSDLESPTTVLSDLPQLRELHISGLKGGIKKPMISNVGILDKLEVLWMSYNELQDIPSSLFDLKRLRRLSLANNKLEILSERLGELSNLEYLYLEKNQLTTLPNSIKKLKKLRHLSLADNPLEIKEKRALQRILPHVQIQF